MIQERENDLIFSTHGRGIFVLHDITPLERLAEAASRPVATLFDPRPAMIHSFRSGPGGSGHRGFSVDNPESDAVVSYFVDSDLSGSDSLDLVVLGDDGSVIRTLEVDATAGVHRVDWDLRHRSAAPPLPDSIRLEDEDDDDEGGFGSGDGPDGPYVFPGVYDLELRLRNGSDDPQTVSATSMQVRRDVRSPLSDGELHDARMWAYEMQGRAHETVRSAATKTRRTLRIRFSSGSKTWRTISTCSPSCRNPITWRLSRMLRPISN